MEPKDCDLVNEDGSLNYDNEFIKMEYREETENSFIYLED